LNILESIDDPNLFGRCFKDKATWKAWRAFLCALFALPMSESELATFKQCTGCDTPPTSPRTEAWLVCGRRAGKSFTLSLIAVYLACFKDWRPFLTSGERGHIVVIAADRKQAKVIFSYIRSLLADTPMLKDLVIRETSDEIDLDNRVTIEVATCSYRTIRGRTVVAALCDEIAYWQSEGSSNPDEEVLAAIRPASATIPGAMLLCASSPYARRGVMYDNYSRYYAQPDAPALIWRAPTLTMNPTVPQRTVDEAYERDPAVAGAEYGAEFRTDVERLLKREVITACVDVGTFERPFDRQHSYYAFCDPSGGSSDAFTLAIGRKEGTTAVLDLIRERLPPFSPEAVIAEYSSAIKGYRIAMVTGDRYAGEFVRELFRKNGVHYEPSEKTKSELYTDLVPALNSSAVALLDHPKLVTQLVGLERRTTRGSRDVIDHGPGAHDDLANSAAGALVGCEHAAPVNFDKPIDYGPMRRYV